MTHLRLAKKGQPDIIQQFYIELLESDRGLSADEYAKDVKRFSKWFARRHGSFVPQAVSALDIVEYRTWMQQEGSTGKGLAPATVNRNLNSIKSFFRFCKDQGFVQHDPTQDIKLVASAAQLAPRWLARNEQAALVRAVKEFGNLRDEAVIITLLHTGLRISELASLKWHDVIINPRSGKVCVTGKGNKYREVPLNSTARKALSRWAEEQEHADYIFPGEKGALTPRAIRNIIYKYAYLAHLEDVSPHILRHTFCKNAIDMGVPLTEVAMMAGHSSLEVTKTYTVPSEKDLQDAVEKMSWE
ncbi:MAG: tyrosine-type recombinase/integrase [Syntrophomonadaceae bacterium]|jgi:site-specific recombinase XerD|nr:tyrosine-type recombinase/integrase [Syntrophomonadaceae bacterium]